MLGNKSKDRKRFWICIGALLAIIVAWIYTYLDQPEVASGITNFNRQRTWGLYIAQFSFLVGVAASAVVVVMPYYLHNHKAFGRMLILGEFLAIPAIVMCVMLIFADMGGPQHIPSVFLQPTPHSMLFWDAVLLLGFLLLNVVISVVSFTAVRKDMPPPRWIMPVIILSILWAISIHLVTAFLYSVLEAHSFLMTVVLVLRFLFSAFAAGPSLLIILALIVRKYTRFDPGTESLRRLVKIVTYFMAANIFFGAVELVAWIYTDIPENMHHFQEVFGGQQPAQGLVVWSWMSLVLGVLALILLLIPSVRKNESALSFICLAVVVSLWMEKGLSTLISGY